jgi:hypothetical protein
MRSDQQFGDTDSGDSGWGGPGSSGKRPWYGPRRFGFGYGPQTWQGYLVTALSVAVLIGAGTAAKGAHWFYGVVIAVIVVHLAIIAIQRR